MRDRISSDKLGGFNWPTEFSRAMGVSLTGGVLSQLSSVPRSRKMIIKWYMPLKHPVSFMID